MEKYTALLNKVLGRMPTERELDVFKPFDPFETDRQKRFAYYNPSRALFLNIDDDHYMYVSNHTNRLRCCLDMATRHLDASSCYQHEHGTIMLGITDPENERHLRSRHINYHIYVQRVDERAASESLAAVSRYADHISLIRDESPWECLCRVSVETNTGSRITASSSRLRKHYEDGLLYMVPDHQHLDFKNAGSSLDSAPVFIGKTVAYPIVSLDNDKELIEIPVSTLKTLLQEQMKNGTSKKVQDQASDISDDISDIDEHGNAVEEVFEHVHMEKQAYPEKYFPFDNGVPELRIDAIPLNGLSFTKNGIELHTLSSIVDLKVRGLDPIALSYYLETKAETPQEIDPCLTAIKKSAKVFGIPIANNCIVPGKHDRLKLFFISRKSSQEYIVEFQKPGNFICLLGDPNGTLKGSAYAHVHDQKEPYSPPGVMSGTLAALADVIKECHDKGIISSATMIGRGGLITALKNASARGLGANIYSERKGPIRNFIFGEPQAAALVTLKENHLIDLARITSNYNLTSTTIGRVSEKPDIVINNQILIEGK